MATKARKTEHAGDKGSSSSEGHWGSREEAKRESSRLRRRRDRDEVKDREREDD